MCAPNLRPLAPIAIALLLLPLDPGAYAHAGGNPGEALPYNPLPDETTPIIDREPLCNHRDATWRDAQVIEGIPVRASRQCAPDDPRWIAAFTKGTNHMPAPLLEDTGIHPDAVRKSDDRDGDGDPDLIEITLEVVEINGWHLPDDTIASTPYEVAPGIETGFWVFAPKTTRFHGGPVDLLWRMPSPSLRVEAGDEVRITLENTHYFPHTIHLHGVDHPFQVEGESEGNDGVPHISEDALLPGGAKTYSFTARHSGTMFYHCHVHPHVHVMMGLNGMINIEPNEPDNLVQTMNIGAGEVRHPSKASSLVADREFDLHYQDVDLDLNNRIDDSNDPRILEKSMHREYDATDAKSDLYLLNGRSFPYTLRESLVTVEENETVLLRVLNGGASPVSLHPHGHKPTRIAVDGVAAQPLQRDVFTLTAAQRIDLLVDTTNNGLDSYGPGAWFMHDHQEQAVTNDGIGPGGDITVIVYDAYQDPANMFPQTLGSSLGMFFSASYYRGEVPVWQGLGMPGVNTDAQPDTSAPPETTQNGLAWFGVALLGFAFWRRRP